MKSSRALRALFGLSLLTIAACTPLRPKITKWHNELKVDPTTLRDHNEIDFGVHGFDLEPKSRGFNALQLTERGQKALINAVGALSDGTVPGLLKGLGTPIKPPAQPLGDIDATIIDRRLVLSITHLPLHPADRVHMLAVRLYPIQNGVEFTNWTQIATRYQTIDLGTLSFDQTQVTKIEASLAPSVLSELTGVKASRESTNGLKEATSLTRNLANLSGRLGPGELAIFEKGAPGQDLTGTISVDTTINLPAGKMPPATITDFRGLFGKVGTPQVPDTVEVSESLMDFPPWGEPVFACAELVAYTRQVCGGGSTITESDDCATMIPTRRVERVMLSPRVYNPLFLLHPRGQESQQLTRPQRGLLLFRSYDAAEEFRRFLQLPIPDRSLPFDVVYPDGTKVSSVSDLEIKAYAPYLNASSGQASEDDCVAKIDEYRTEYRRLKHPANPSGPKNKELLFLNEYRNVGGIKTQELIDIERSQRGKRKEQLKSNGAPK